MPWLVPWSPEQVTRFSWNPELQTDCYEILCWFWELNLQEQTVPLTTEPSLPVILHLEACCGGALSGFKLRSLLLQLQSSLLLHFLTR